MSDEENGIRYSHWFTELLFMVTMLGIMLLIGDMIRAYFTM